MVVLRRGGLFLMSKVPLYLGGSEELQARGAVLFGNHGVRLGKLRGPWLLLHQAPEVDRDNLGYGDRGCQMSNGGAASGVRASTPLYPPSFASTIRLHRPHPAVAN